MRRLSILALVPLALLAAACGGGGSKGGGKVSGDDAAVVGSEHITRESLDRRLGQAKCSYTLQKRPFPKAGSPEYLAIQQQILQSLVQRAELAQKAPGLGVKVTDAEIEKQLKQIKKQYFGGSEKRYQAELKKQCVTDAEVRSDVGANVLSDEIYKKVTTGAKVTDTEVKAYYDSHTSVYTQPETRVVRHILVKDKALADKLYSQLKGGADFAALAKKYSQDPGSKAQGGELTISRGQTVPQFDKVAFQLKKGELSQPVKTQYGYHVIQALSEIKPAQSTPFAKVEASIKQQLEQQRKNDEMTKWVEDKKKSYCKSGIKYQVGYQPNPDPCATVSGTTTTTSQ